MVISIVLNINNHMGTNVHTHRKKKDGKEIEGDFKNFT